MIKRKLVNVYLPQEEQGFLGSGHTARQLLNRDFYYTDPFIMLADDMLAKKDSSPSGGPHPHAGFETVSLLVDGKITEALESMEKGNFQIMTAGSGIVHTETINEPTTGRLFQLWLNLPKKERWTSPRLQILPSDHTPVLEQNGLQLRVYSGSVNNVTSPVLNYVPLIVAEINLDAGTTATLQIPADFNSFLVVIGGSVSVGENKNPLSKNQVGWLDLINNNEISELILETRDESVRLILYAAKPLKEKFVSHGPFIADNEDDIQRLYKEYRSGNMQHIKNAPQTERINY